MRHGRTTARTVVATACALSALLLGGPPATADPGTADQGAAEVGRIESRLAEATARMHAADVAASIAAEEYDAAVIDLEEARRATALAEAGARAADRRLEGARREVGRIAARTYRQGAVGALDVVLSPHGPQDVLDRASMLRVLGDQRRRTVQRMDAARMVASVLQRQAEKALEEQEAAARRLAGARAAAEQQAAGAHAEVTGLQSEQAALLARLATLRGTTVDAERARHEAASEQPASEQAPPAAPAPDGPASPAADDEAAPPAPAPAAPTAAPAVPSAAPTSTPSSRPSTQAPAPAPSTTRPKPAPKPAPTTPAGSSRGSAAGGRAAVAWAKQQVGLPYRWGGAGPGSYDCSGLTMRAWERAGVSLPHSSRYQYRTVQKISLGQMRPGDLLFYATDTGDPDTIHHVTMYAGNGLMVEAPATGLKVRVVPVRTKGRMPSAGRP